MFKFLILFFILTSCGKNDSGSARQEQVLDDDGFFYGKISPLNQSSASGFVKINKVGDSVEITVKTRGLKFGSTTQFLYVNERCPLTDMNSDGKIDLREISALSGPRIVELMEGTHESSYSLLLADLGREGMNFNKRSMVVFQGEHPVGCAEIEDMIFEPQEEEEVKPPVPSRDPPSTDGDYTPPEPPQASSSWWNRLSNRMRNWWCRVRGRCS